MSGRNADTSVSAANEPSGTRVGLAVAMGAILLFTGLAVLAGSASAAPSDPPSVDVEEGFRTTHDQTLVIRAENTNDDQATSWDVDAPSYVTIDSTSVSDDERTFWAQLTITQDAPANNPFDVTFTATDGQGLTDTANTTLDARDNPDEADVQPLQNALVEDTDHNLTADVHLFGDTVATVEMIKNYPGVPTKEAEPLSGDTWTAGPFNYENTGIHHVGYRTVDDEGHQVTVVHDIDVTEKAPEISAPVDQLDVEAGQRISFVLSATDSDGEALSDWRIDFKNDAEVTDVEVDPNGNQARLWVTFTEPQDHVTHVVVAVNDTHGEVGTKDTQFNFGNTPDLSTSSPSQVQEDVDVTLTGSFDDADLDASSIEIWKNFEWEDELFKDKSQSNQVDSNTYSATFNYDLPAVHHPGYTAQLADGGEVTLVGDLEVTEQAPELSAIDSLDVAEGQTISFEVSYTDSDNEDIADWRIGFVNPDEVLDAQLLVDGDTAHFLGTISENNDGATQVIIEAEDTQGAVGDDRTVFVIGDDPDITTSSPASSVEDTSVTLSTTVDIADRSPADVQIFKNYIWQGDLLAQNSASNQVDEDTWEATFTYGLVGTHFPGYQIQTADGDTATLVGELEITEQVPEVSSAIGFRAEETQRVAVIATAVDDSTVDWEVDDGGVGGDVFVDGNEVRWEFTIPLDPGYDRINVKFTATDDAGLTASSTTKVHLKDDPVIEPAPPKEIDTGIFAINPILGEDLRLAANVDNDDVETQIVNNWPSGATFDTTEIAEDLFAISGISYDTPGKTQVGYLITGERGNQVAVIQEIFPEENDAPTVSTHPDVTLDGSGDAPLRSFAEDPEARTLEQYDWFYVDGPRLDAGQDEFLLGSGPNVGGDAAHFEQMGTHELEVRVTDPYGLTGTSTMTVQVDDLIDATGVLTNADGQTDGVYVVDPTTHAMDRLEGNVSVVDGFGNPVADAIVEGEVLYYGSQGNTVGAPVADFTTTTGSSGNATFEFDQDLMGSTGRGESLASFPGYHEIHITVSVPSDPSAPVDDTETADVMIPYHVGTGIVGPT